MCGIIGYTGSEDCAPILLQGLQALEYRGYDSAGIAIRQGEETVTVKTRGRLTALTEKWNLRENRSGTCGIGHTRWATHGVPSDINSHPHTTPHLALVHNGIIENYTEIEEILQKEGYSFQSDTDTERAACLLDRFYRSSHDPIDAIHRACRLLRGSYAFVILFRDIPDVLYAVRQDSPLIAARSETGVLLASDLPAILPYTRHYYRLAEGVIAECHANGIRFWGKDGEAVSQEEETANWNTEQAQKGGYAHFMHKEIHEEPDVLHKTVAAHLRDDLPYFGADDPNGDGWANISALHLVACGTAMHAGLVGKVMIENLAKLPVQVELAGEFRYRDPILNPNDLVILLSQSGETADTLAALRYAKAKGIRTLAIVNVLGSSVAREADLTWYTQAGPEIAVASTKAYHTQCALLYLLALHLAECRHTRPKSEISDLCRTLRNDLPTAIRQTLTQEHVIARLASRLTDKEHVFYIGRGMDWVLCQEGSLKLKEISYIHSEAYAAGELKHGTISLITDGTPVIALATVPSLCEKMISGIREVKSRGAWVLVLTTPSLAKQYAIPGDEQFLLPEADAFLTPFSAGTALQLLAYHVARQKGLDVDKPRNLAKSVTVE